MLKTVKDLAMAMINATLILIVLCLFLAWKVVDQADQIASDFASNLVSIQPLRDDLQGATDELAALRHDVAQIAGQTGDLQSTSLKRIETRLTQMDTRMAGARQSVADLAQAPTRLVDHAIDTAADKLATTLTRVRGCVPPQS